MRSTRGCAGSRAGSTCCRWRGGRAAARGRAPARALAITFDDGYADNATVAAPILLRLGLPATFFVATGFLDGGRMWNDTVIEAVAPRRGPVLDLAPLGLGGTRSPMHGSAGNDRPAARRAQVSCRSSSVLETANRIAESSAPICPDDLMMCGPVSGCTRPA